MKDLMSIDQNDQEDLFNIKQHGSSLAKFYDKDFDIFEFRNTVSRHNVLPLVAAFLYQDFQMFDIIGRS